jgi:hypothetical protein
MARYYVIVPSKGEHWGPYTRLLQAQDFARIGSQHGSPREVRRDKVKGKRVREYAEGKRAWPTTARQLRGLLPGEVPRDFRKENPTMSRSTTNYGERWRRFKDLGFYRVEEDDQEEYVEGHEYPRWTVWVKKTPKGKLIGGGDIQYTSLESGKYPRRPPRFELEYGYEASDLYSRNREEFRSLSDAVDWIVEGTLTGWSGEVWERNPMRPQTRMPWELEITPKIQASGFLSSYFETALWSSTDEHSGRPMDENYDLNSFAENTLIDMVAEAEAWRDSVEPILEDLEGFDESQVGHDFWLVRNGFGAGFWDGDWPEPEASKLTKAAKNAGEIHLYIDDDGLIYSYRG